jgi:hypothetical protein
MIGSCGNVLNYFFPRSYKITRLVLKTFFKTICTQYTMRQKAYTPLFLEKIVLCNGDLISNKINVQYLVPGTYKSNISFAEYTGNMCGSATKLQRNG